ncbi:hypothetical protein PGT21_017618 [Puccinia graminis f. sp. tritici]|uniref:Uncharacterized protein n=1 Tax=Puccinia graminis f. sp. tritici TaxID=56615 RepID=A0A5B0PLF4_PUCGR|nr:hypothetical protein PGT21_017618 [Puccinia graminis f. sp. tritici]KAA1136622.1 hypothetical protein PGTUg99_036429 [Puccinia graminis f. sp. tritici]
MARVSFNHPETVLAIEALTNICTLPGCDVTGWIVRAGVSGRNGWVISTVSRFLFRGLFFLDALCTHNSCAASQSPLHSSSIFFFIHLQSSNCLKVQSRLTLADGLPDGLTS